MPAARLGIFLVNADLSLGRCDNLKALEGKDHGRDRQFTPANLRRHFLPTATLPGEIPLLFA